MANSFKNYTVGSIGTSGQNVYTVPSGTTGIMIGCNVANVTSSSITVDATVNGVHIVKGATVPAGSALSILEGKIILETGNSVNVTSSTDNSADVILSVLEQT